MVHQVQNPIYVPVKATFIWYSAPAAVYFHDLSHEAI